MTSDDGREAGRERLRRAFLRFAETEAVPQGSPIYEALCHVVAGDELLLDVASEAAPGQPVPNLLFGAVHAVLEEHPQAELAAYYPSHSGRGSEDTRALDVGLGEAFRAFVVDQRDEVVEILHTRLVQTNEVRRSAVLLPVFATVEAEAGGAPLALIEVGASAGLNLLVDRYGYRYSATPAGDPASPLVLETEVRGGEPPIARVPRIVSRLGLELNALDVRDPADMRWLRSLVWPEHEQRREILEAAIALAQDDPPEVRTVDVFEALPGAIAKAPAEAAVVVFATFVLNQFSPEMRERLRAVLLEASRVRDVYLVVVGFAEWFGDERPADGSAPVHLATLQGGAGQVRRLALSSPHGWWIDWSPGVTKGW